MPEKTIASLEYRSADLAQFRELGTAVLALAEEKAEEFGLGLEIEFLGERDPVEMDPKFQAAIRDVAEQLGLRCQTIFSRAGHDAQAIASICPAGMIFVPSVGGNSHSPAEFTNWQDCVHGANVLLRTTLKIAANWQTSAATTSSAT